MQAETEAPWFVVLTEPQQAMQAVWRLHELGQELYVPIVRQRVKTGRKSKSGQKLTRIAPRPMFPGYGFLRANGVSDLGKICDTRGVRDVMRIKTVPVFLPHAAVMAVFKQQYLEHREFLREIGARQSHFKPGDLIRVDEGGVYTGMVGSVTRIDTKGRLEVLFGMIRHTMPEDMVVAA